MIAQSLHKLSLFKFNYVAQTQRKYFRFDMFIFRISQHILIMHIVL